MTYPPLKEGQQDVNKLFFEMFGLVMPEKVAEEVVKRDVRLTIDPVRVTPNRSLARLQ
jgi:hypothetical protein